MEIDKKFADRFWSKVEKTDGCWNWNKPSERDGYGCFGVTTGKRVRKVYRVHRLSWILTNGDIPDGLYVLHKCDNPTCVRPDHLFVGTQTDNMRDMWSKGRGRSTKGTTKSVPLARTKLNYEKAIEIRRLRKEEAVSYRKLAKKFNVSATNIILVIQNKIWREELHA